MSALYRNAIRFFRVIGTIFILQIMGGMLPAHAAEPGTTAPLLTVYKDANCGCCEKWLAHISERGFSVDAYNINNLYEFKLSKGIPASMQSCHTAVSSQGYVFEGHIPAKFISRFLATPPKDAIGLTVPAMPVGSPGMEYQDKFMSYQVLLLKNDGSSQVYAQVNSLEESVQ
ncbi:DUF411 domain-containing protein [Shewanella baltica]|uniref:DUF411 domain-containing protein n=1 Tax=Shewanella TaxID=22 RepID=UPI00200E13BB|nr:MULTISPECIES: DUF411 domain-containing protein [Shewanella]MCL1090315.1 DUF411 domain-containing protein [Shewanella profunda]MCS6117000.1 DUF411 domain-containing protein [Shewanella baltica]MCS6129904.1 DUF411 domain-containing protein [Shewanella baltica]MCS6141834.1 DUF411 domain-containing protein [Shewanella baltica]MCS6148154.1 DUF411 domain-containing protein [Shewanella baltica]